MPKMLNANAVEYSGTPDIHILVTTDSSIQGHEELIQWVEAETRRMLGHFASQIMSIEVHFTDENGVKSGSDDKRCLMEARCSGRPPVAVSDESPTIKGSFHGAVKKLQRLLASSFGKAGSHKGGDTIRKENKVERDSISPDRL